MTDLNKTPLKNLPIRYEWWNNYAQFLKKTANNLEDSLYDVFRDERYGETPDVDAPIARHILNVLYELADFAKEHADSLKKPLDQYERFIWYWQFGRGEWNGMQEFLHEEASNS